MISLTADDLTSNNSVAFANYQAYKLSRGGDLFTPMWTRACARRAPRTYQLARGTLRLADTIWPPKEVLMNRALLCFLTFLVLSFALIGCGGGSSISPKAQITRFAFLQGNAGQTGTLSVMLGTFAVTASKVEFSARPGAYWRSGDPISGDVYSIALSPDGNRTLFDMYTFPLGGGFQLQWDILNASVANQGDQPLRVTNDEYVDSMPQFSPDGNSVVFVSENGPAISIAIKNADGTGTEQFLPIPAGVSAEQSPTYSPDGRRIAMEAWGYDQNNVPFDGIWVMDVDGGNPKMLTNPLSATCNCWDEMPAFSADGSKIFFSGYGAPNSTADVEDIYVMNADGSGVSRLTDGVGVNFDPMLLSIAGLGERILFSSNRSNPADVTSGSFELYSMRTDGSEVTRLTSNSLYEGFCAELYDVGTMKALGAPRTRLRHSAARPSWR